MVLAIIITCICLIFQAERGILDTLGMIRVLRKLRTPLKPSPTKAQKHLYILLPVLREQAIIIATLQRMYSVFGPQARIIIITTEKENKERKIKAPDQLTTGDLIIQEISHGALKDFGQSFEVIHYPDANGRMAHQINFALTQILARDPKAHFILYNADSIPSPTTSIALERSMELDLQGAYQQPCAFIRDVNKDSPLFMNALSLFQSVFCIGHETSIIERYSKKNSALGVLVGHGSAMSVKICLDHGGFPTDYVTEDLTFGFILSAQRVPIHSLDSIELADVPRSLASFIQQRTVWFWNFLEFFRCYRDLTARSISDPRHRRELLVIGLSRGAYWLCASFFYALPLVLGVVYMDTWTVLAGLAGFICFQILPSIILLKMLPVTLERQGLDQNAKDFKSLPIIQTLLMLPVVVFTDSIGPWIAVCQFLRWKITGILPNKPKTD